MLLKRKNKKKKKKKKKNSNNNKMRDCESCVAANKYCVRIAVIITVYIYGKNFFRHIKHSIMANSTAKN